MALSQEQQQVLQNLHTAHPTAPPTAPSGTQSQTDAYTYLQGVLNDYGLASLAPWAWKELVNGAGSSQVLLEMYQTPEFKTRFPAIALRQQKGLPPINPGDYVNYERAATEAMREAGLPQDFWDKPEDFTSLLANDVSIHELQTRVGMAQQATYQVPQEVRDTLARDYGLTDGHLAAFFLDPARAEPLLARDFTAAQIGGAAQITGYQTNRTQNERLADLGVTQQQAQSGFTQLANGQQLFTSLPGENTTGISQDEQLAAVFGGDAAAQRKIQQRAQQRQAVFDGGGGFAATQGGLAGVGEAQGA